jgi:site-specific DNA recombinase
MIHTWTRKDGRLYRYYTCSAAQKRGQDTCPTGSIPAGTVEEFVVDQIRAIGSDPRLQRETFRQALAQVAAQRRALKAEEKRLRNEVPRVRTEVDRLVNTVAAAPRPETAGPIHARLVDAQDRLVAIEARQREVRTQVENLAGLQVEEADLGRALQSFTPIWGVLHAAERERILRLLIDTVRYDAQSGDMAFTFRIAGLGALADETTRGGTS